jgi:dTDP-glucose 4,6-dehydratase
LRTILVTGGCGFIGSAVVRALLADESVSIVNVDALTYAANPQTGAMLERLPRYRLEHGDICDAALLRRVLRARQPSAIVDLAAETHVDRSIDAATAFLRTNVTGTAILLEAATQHWRSLDRAAQDMFRFLHVSTDEVYGSLGPTGRSTEETAYAPNSPYAASKAASDHLVRAWSRTHGLPTVTSNGSNTYGP